MRSAHRKSAIALVEQDRILLRGYDIADLTGGISWGAAVLLILTGEIPDPRIGRMMEAILVSIIDHGPTPASTLAACTVASTGASLNAAVAAGILAIAKYHGGAIENCMAMLQECVAFDQSPAQSAVAMIEKYRKSGDRLPGFGHRQHVRDPRVEKLLQLAQQEGIAAKHVEQARALEAELARTKQKPLPLNADGAIAALLCDISFPKEAANGIFMIARIPGLVAHCVEERSRNAALLPIDPASYEYDGPQKRKLPRQDRQEMPSR